MNSFLPLFFSIWVSFGLLTECQQHEAQAPELRITEQVDLEDTSRLATTDSLSLHLFNEVMAYAKQNQLSVQPIGMIVQEIGEWFMKKPYVAGTLDQFEEEQLVIKLDGFDCVTFVESTLALSRTIAANKYSFNDFKDKIIEQRYRESTVNGYCSRLHYFSEWIYRNSEKGLVANITEELGGVLLEKKLDFMSTHRESYPQLATDESLFAELVVIEEALYDLDIFYIPQDQIRETYDLLQAGDVIALATDIKGLDVVHTGFVHKDASGKTGLMHASTSQGVTVSPDLQDYVENNKRQIGILVARPKA